MTETTTRTTCPYCGVGCGVVATVDSSSGITVSGDEQHPANAGKLCSKGLALAETFNDQHRLLQPMVDGVACDWNSASSHIAMQLTDVIERHGRESVAFYVSGQLLTEDYYVVNKFVKGWLGTANIDTNSRLCMASSVVGHKRAFGSDTVPGCYEDLDEADLIVLVGSNLAWCHPVIYQRIMAAKARRPELFIVVIDPRRSVTADGADLHLPIKPDGDTLLFNALLDHLDAQGIVDKDYVNAHVSGFNEALDEARATLSDDSEDVATTLGVTQENLQLFFNKVATTPKTVTVYSQGVNQSGSGTDKVNAIINCHLATGRIGRSGMGPFSITGQPNAMGGREVGGLATMLACHRDLDNAEHRSQVQRFWCSPHIADKVGLTAVDMFKAVEQGTIKAIWIMATNPVDSLPEADQVARALEDCPLVIVSEVTHRSDTLSYANVVLPAQAFGEKDGTVTNSERRISRQRRFIEPAGQSRPDWWAVAQVAKHMGYGESFDYNSPADIFAEYAQLSSFENDGAIDFDIGAYSDVQRAEYDAMPPFQWPKPEHALELNQAKPIRFFANGGFYTPDARARMLPITAAEPGNSQLSDNFPLILNTGRIRDQWHTMTRTGYIARLSLHRAEPFIELNQADAVTHGIDDADIVRIDSPHGHALARAIITDRQQPGQVFMPMHWTNQFSSQARVDALMQARTDPFSRQPASKNQAVRLRRFTAGSYAFLMTRSEPALQQMTDTEYWASSMIDAGWRTELASSITPEELVYTVLENIIHQMLDASTLDCVEYAAGKVSRMAWFNKNNELVALLYSAPESVEISRSWAIELFKQPAKDHSARWQVMAGRASLDQPDKGAIVCSCFSVGDKQIQRAITEDGCATVEAVGKQLSAGTNCGSCRNEIGALIKQCCKVAVP